MNICMNMKKSKYLWEGEIINRCNEKNYLGVKIDRNGYHEEETDNVINKRKYESLRIICRIYQKKSIKMVWMARQITKGVWMDSNRQKEEGKT